MGFGHIYVNAEQERVISHIGDYLSKRGFRSVTMTPEFHPKEMKQINETEMRLYWVSPRIEKWTGIFEFSYYSNEPRERWGYTDGELAKSLSQMPEAEVYQMEVIDTAGFWYYNYFVKGEEGDYKVYQGNPYLRGEEEGKKRNALIEIVKRKGITNFGLTYENIPGEMVAPVGPIRHWQDGIIGYDSFRHLAFAIHEFKKEF